MISAILAWLAIYWIPIAGALLMVLMFWHLFRTVRDPDFIAMQQKAAYDEAHAYTKGKYCCGRDKD